MAGLVYTSDVFGGAAAISVATFGDLPVSGDVDQRIIVTGETSLFSSSYPVICIWEDTQWKLESARCTYANLGAAEFAIGVWVGTGASINTSAKCQIIDTTYNECWVWNTTNSVFLPSRLSDKTINNIKSIKGNSTSPSGWVLNTSVGTGGSPNGSTLVTTSAISVGGPTGLQSTATSTTSQLTGTYIQYAFTDENISTTTNFYVKTLLVHSLSRGGSGHVSVRFQYENGTSAVDFGAIKSISGGDKDGIYYNAQTVATYTTAAGGTNTEDVMTTATLVQFYVEGGRSFVKIGTNPWKNVTVLYGLQRNSNPPTKGFSIVTASQPSATAAFNATSKIAYLQAIRYS